MGFLSYSLKFYRHELRMLEERPATQAALYRARQPLRMLDDLTDEGYTELTALLEKELCGVSRLRAYLRDNHTESFCIAGSRPGDEKFSYSPYETELCEAVRQAVREANRLTETVTPPFADRLRGFCRWIGYAEDTAYIFLLRDPLLPFAYFLGRDRERILSVAAQPARLCAIDRAGKCGRGDQSCGLPGTGSRVRGLSVVSSCGFAGYAENPCRLSGGGKCPAPYVKRY